MSVYSREVPEVQVEGFAVQKLEFGKVRTLLFEKYCRGKEEICSIRTAIKNQTTN